MLGGKETGLRCQTNAEQTPHNTQHIVQHHNVGAVHGRTCSQWEHTNVGAVHGRTCSQWEHTNVGTVHGRTCSQWEHINSTPQDTSPTRTLE